MKVKDLIAVLQQQDPEATVVREVPSHDYWGTTLALSVLAVEEVRIKHSAYHDTNQIIDPFEDDANGGGDDGSQGAVCIS